jgi:hypothetical protein
MLPMNASPRLRMSWDWIAGYALLGLAAVLLTVTWVAASGSRFISDQLSYIVSGGLGGLVLLGLAAVLIVTAGLSDEWRKLNRIEAALTGPPAEAPTDASALVRRTRIVAGLGLALAVAFLVPAWVKVSGDADPKPGLGAATWAVVGLVIGGLIAALATLRVQRLIQARKRRLFAPFTPALAEDSGAALAEVRSVPAGGLVLIAPELTRFHRPGCPAVEGIATNGVAMRSIPPTLEPCDLCEADVLAREERSWTSVAG